MAWLADNPPEVGPLFFGGGIVAYWYSLTTGTITCGAIITCNEVIQCP